jgi:hypothetical protein
MKKYLFTFLIIVVALALASTSFAASTTKIIGIATVKKGVILPVVLHLPTGPVAGTVQAFKDQELYIEMKLPADVDGAHRGGYILIGSGFIHDCPIHGAEPMDETTVLVPMEEVENGNVTIKLF